MKKIIYCSGFIYAISLTTEPTCCEGDVIYIYIHPSEDITSLDNIRWDPIYVNAFSVVLVKIKSGPEGTNHSGPEGRPTSTSERILLL